MQKRKKINITTALILAAALSIGLPCYAGTQEEIDSVVASNEEAQADLVSIEERLASLEAQKGDTQNYLNELTNQLNGLQSNLEILQTQYEEKQAEITQVQAQLEESRILEQTQYENMKLRIQYIYEESSDAGLLESLFSADSFTDFLNRADEMSQINQFDREMLQSYEETVEDIESKEALLLTEQQEITELQNSISEQRESIELIYEDSYRELEACLVEISTSENAQSELAEQIRAQEELLDQLTAQKAAEEAARLASEEQARQAAVAAEAAQAAADNAGYEYQPAQSPSQSAPVQQTPSQEPEQAISQDTGNLTYLGNFTLTAYCSCAKCCGKWAAYGGITASGAQCQEGVTVAMGGVPFGTQLVINGHTYTVQDRGTPYGHVDIYFSSHSAACAFGLKHADVYQVN